MADEADRITTISTATAASLLLFASPSELTSLARAGWVKPIAKDRWRLVDVVQGAIRYMRARRDEVSTRELASVLDVTAAWVQRLERSGVIRRTGKNTWPLAETVRAYIAHLRSLKQTQPTSTTMVSMEGFARHIGLSREMVRRLIAENVLTPEADGRLDQDKSRLAYLQHLRERPTRSQAADLLREAKAEEVRLRLAERMHELIERPAASEVVEDVVASLLIGLQGLAARVGGRDLALRRKIDDEIFRIRKDAADRLKKHAASLRETGQAARLSFSAPA